MHEYSTGDLLSEDILDIVAMPTFREFAERRKTVPADCHDMDCEFIEYCRGGCAARTFFCHGRIDARDPYCPKEYIAQTGKRPALPVRPTIGVGHGVRVHDNYLCTWIGNVDPTFQDARFPTLAHFGSQANQHGLTPDIPLSGCRQVGAEDVVVSLESFDTLPVRAV